MLALLAIIAGIAGLSVLNGWVLSVLWGWFVVPLGVAQLHTVGAIGLSLVVSLLVGGNRAVTTGSSGTADESKAVTNLVIAVLVPFVLLGIGWVIHCFQ